MHTAKKMEELQQREDTLTKCISTTIFDTNYNIKETNQLSLRERILQKKLEELQQRVNQLTLKM